MILKIEKRDALKVARRHVVLIYMDQTRTEKEVRWHLTDSIDLVKSRIGGNKRSGRYWYYLVGKEMDLYAFLLANNIRLAMTYRVPEDLSGDSRIVVEETLRECVELHPRLRKMVNKALKTLGLMEISEDD